MSSTPLVVIVGLTSLPGARASLLRNSVADDGVGPLLGKCPEGHDPAERVRRRRRRPVRDDYNDNDNEGEETGDGATARG